MAAIRVDMRDVYSNAGDGKAFLEERSEARTAARGNDFPRGWYTDHLAAAEPGCVPRDPSNAFTEKRFRAEQQRPPLDNFSTYKLYHFGFTADARFPRARNLVTLKQRGYRGDFNANCSARRAKTSKAVGSHRNVSTEDFRVALRRYRSFFSRLLAI